LQVNLTRVSGLQYVRLYFASLLKKRSRVKICCWNRSPHIPECSDVLHLSIHLNIQSILLLFKMLSVKLGACHVFLPTVR